jgi:MtN3 and saliva related transmembrane protein
MSQQWIAALGIAAAIGTTGAFLPQVLKTWKTRQTDDFSWGYLTLFSTGTTLWLIYGLLRKDTAVIGANAITLVLVLVIAGVKFKSG